MAECRGCGARTSYDNSDVNWVVIDGEPTAMCFYCGEPLDGIEWDQPMETDGDGEDTSYVRTGGDGGNGFMLFLVIAFAFGIILRLFAWLSSLFSPDLSEIIRRSG